MPIDPILGAVLAENFVVAAMWGGTLIKLGNEKRRVRNALRASAIHGEEVDRLRADNKALGEELLILQTRDYERRQHLRKAGLKGGEATKRVNEKRRKEAQAKTLEELSRTKLRSPAQVKAPVKAKRTRAKKAAAAV